jgi:hypothetical protein
MSRPPRWQLEWDAITPAPWVWTHRQLLVIVRTVRAIESAGTADTWREGCTTHSHGTARAKL